jgi:hypothetical protein
MPFLTVLANIGFAASMHLLLSASIRFLRLLVPEGKGNSIASSSGHDDRFLRPYLLMCYVLLLLQIDADPLDCFTLPAFLSQQ